MPRKSVLDDHLDIVGKLTDREVAGRTGLTPEAVRSYRKRRDILAECQQEGAQVTVKTSKKSKKKPGRKSKLDGYRRFLGKRSDQQVADWAGLTLSAVRQYRYKHDIKLDKEAIEAAAVEAAAVKQQPKPKKRKKRRKSKLDRFRKVLGTIPDQEVAAQAGVKLSTVRKYRYSKGIKLALRGTEGLPDAPQPVEASPKPSATEKAVGAAQSAPTRWAYTIAVKVGDQETSYTVIAADVAEAGRVALDALRVRSPDAVVQAVTLGSEVLES